MSEFKPFPKIERLEKVTMCITQKLHGTNAQIAIEPNDSGELELRVGCRTRWITPEEDNFGFAAHVYANKQEFIEKLGVGVHFGEWVGPGINSGEGMSTKTFVLFAHWRYPEGRPLPPNTTVVPVLYKGPLDLSKVDAAMSDLKATGSKLSPGFMRPEGVVVQIDNKLYKMVFESEETKWRKGDGNKERVKSLSKKDYSSLLQPLRLEKLLSRDEVYVRNYPESLPEIVKAYVEDLEAEGEISGTDDEVRAIRKGVSGLIYKFVRDTIGQRI